MTSSATYAFAPDNVDLIEEAFERCLVDPATLVARHFKSASSSLNFLFSDWATRGQRAFQIDEQTQAMTASDADYTAASGTLYILEGVIRRSGIDSQVSRMTREQYQLIPDKTAEGLPTQVWLDRATGIYYLWQVPENSTDVFRYRRLRRIQDAGTGLQTPDVPYEWFEALVSGLSAKLALKFAPARVDALEQRAEMAFKRAMDNDRERADTSFGIGDA